MEALNRTFQVCIQESRAAFITYVTAGYPTAASTPDILFAMQAGGTGKFLPRVQTLPSIILSLRAFI